MLFDLNNLPWPLLFVTDCSDSETSDSVGVKHVAYDTAVRNSDLRK